MIIFLKILASVLLFILFMLVAVFLICTTAILAWGATPDKPPKIVE